MTVRYMRYTLIERNENSDKTVLEDVEQPEISRKADGSKNVTYILDVTYSF